MAVITRYIVVRKGIELEPVFAIKKEAEAYDKMLDAAEALAGFIKSSELAIPLDEAAIDAVALLMAKKGPEVVKILKGIKPVLTPSEAADPASHEKTTPVSDRKGTKRAPSKRGAKSE